MEISAVLKKTLRHNLPTNKSCDDIKKQLYKRLFVAEAIAYHSAIVIQHNTSRGHLNQLFLVIDIPVS